MRFFEYWFVIKKMVSILYWRMCHEVFQAGFNLTSLFFACAIHCAGRILRSYGSRQRAVGPARATFPSRAAATRGADRLVPGRTRCADTRRFHISHPVCGGGSVDADRFKPQGGRAGKEI